MSNHPTVPHFRDHTQFAVWDPFHDSPGLSGSRSGSNATTETGTAMSDSRSVLCRGARYENLIREGRQLSRNCNSGDHCEAGSAPCCAAILQLRALTPKCSRNQREKLFGVEKASISEISVSE